MKLYDKAKVALRKESVDRNLKSRHKRRLHLSSLSARRAWIEILAVKASPNNKLSLSARRAWIEIWQIRLHSNPSGVALRKESVDRN